MPNNNIEVVHQYQMVLEWLRLKHMKKLNEVQNETVHLPHKNSKLLLFKNPINNKVIKMMLDWQ